MNRLRIRHHGSIRVALCVAALLWLAAPRAASAQLVSNQADPPTTPASATLPTPEQACASSCGQTPCEWLEFHGFSPDSSRLGFSILKCPGSSASATARRFFHVRTLKGRLGRMGMSEEKLKGVHFTRYFRRQGFHVAEVLPSSQELEHWTASLGEGRRLSVDLLTEKTMVLEIAGYEGQERLFVSKVPLHDIYFGMAVQAYLSPDGKRVLVVAHLDAQYKWDLWSGAFSLAP